MGAHFTHDFPFDPAYGHSLDDLRRVGVPAAPGDFDAFWRSRYEAALRVDPAPEAGRLEEERDGVRIFAVTYTSVGGVRIGGRLVLPADGPVEHGFVIGHGYGGRDAAGPDVPLPLPRSAALLPCVRGMGDRSLLPGIPATAGAHVLHGIGSRDTYVIGDCVADLWCAASALLALVPELDSRGGPGLGSGPGPGLGPSPDPVPVPGPRLGYLGESFGGGLGALALPWDARFAAGQLTVPTFGNHPLRLTLPCVGSGEPVRTYHRSHPEVTGVLRYFDAATAATRIRVPVLVAAARFDPSVPPPGQFAVVNGLAEQGELRVLSAGHFEHPGAEAEARELALAKREFFARQAV